MLLRIWKVGLAPAKAAELEIFAKNISLPMFKAQPGCLAVFFTRTEKQCATVTLWESEHAVEEMERSSHYQQILRQIEQRAILGENSETSVYSVYGGFVSAEASHLIAQAWGLDN